MYSTTMLLSTRLYFLLGIVSLSSLTAVFSFDIDSTIVDNPSLPVVSRDRALQGTAVTTSACDNIRTQRFPAKLELVYFYVLETTNGPLEDLSGIQNAILRAVLEALQRCDGNGFPEFALDLATKHEYSENGFCISQDRENDCSVVKGRTDIYLDARVNEARDIAYTAIQQALADQSFMILYEPSIVRSRFEESIQENLVLVPVESAVPDVVEASSTPSLVKVAIAISSIAFVVASIFSYGFLRRQSQLNERRQETIVRRQQEKRRKVDRRRHRHFSALESDDGTPNEGPVIHLASRSDDDARSVGWSVSDITSDSGSVQSILSRSTSRLEIIEEEPTNGDEDRVDIEAAIQKELSVQTDMEAEDAALSSHYTAAYVAHKSRLREIVKNALFDSDVEDDEMYYYDEEEDKKTTPKTEDSKSISFGSNDTLTIFGSEKASSPSSPPPPSLVEEEDGENSSLGHYHTPESAKTDGGLISVLTMDEFPSPVRYEAVDPPSSLLHMDLDISSDSRDSDASLQRWLSHLLVELQTAQDVKRIES